MTPDRTFYIIGGLETVIGLCGVAFYVKEAFSDILQNYGFLTYAAVVLLFTLVCGVLTMVRKSWRWATAGAIAVVLCMVLIGLMFYSITFGF
jgi:uncharacterized BrkB/YihY/UPF0761 family membrane protein